MPHLFPTPRLSRATLAIFAGLPACVPSVPHFVTAAEARAGYPYENAEYRSADLSFPSHSKRENPEVTSYWHYNGLAFEWIESPAQPANPGYLWAWQEDP